MKRKAEDNTQKRTKRTKRSQYFNLSKEVIKNAKEDISKRIKLYEEKADAQSNMEIDHSRDTLSSDNIVIDLDIIELERVNYKEVHAAYKSVSLFNMELSHVGGDVWQQFVQHLNPALKVLTLRGRLFHSCMQKTPSGDLYRGCIALAAFLQRSKLEELYIDLSLNNGLIPILLALGKSKTLTHFSLGRSGLSIVDDAVFKGVLRDFLPDNTILKSLTFHATSLGVGKVEALARRLRNNQSITALTLSGISLTAPNIDKILEALKDNKSIRSLDLSNNAISAASTKRIYSVLKLNTSSVMQLYLTELNIDKHILPQLRTLGKLAQANPNIVHIDCPQPTKEIEKEKALTKIAAITTQCTANEDAIKMKIQNCDANSDDVQAMLEDITKARFISGDAHKQISTALHTVRYRVLASLLEENLGPYLGALPPELRVMIMSFIPEGGVQLAVGKQTFSF